MVREPRGEFLPEVPEEEIGGTLITSVLRRGSKDRRSVRLLTLQVHDIEMVVVFDNGDGFLNVDATLLDEDNPGALLGDGLTLRPRRNDPPAAALDFNLYTEGPLEKFVWRAAHERLLRSQRWKGRSNNQAQWHSPLIAQRVWRTGQ